MLDCRVTETRLKPLRHKPLLSIVIPAWERVPELIMTVESLASQITDGLEDKVEIIISDDASGPEAQSAMRALSDRFVSVSYVFNEENLGGAFQIFAACWRSRGEWTWAFGSDDLVSPGGLAHLVSVLESEQPDFLSMNRKCYNADLSQVIYPKLLGIPNRSFNGFSSLMCGSGFHQTCFISCSLERTSSARNVDGSKYLKLNTLHPHVLSYFEKHKNSKCFYWDETYLTHRMNNSHNVYYEKSSYRDIGWQTPILIMQNEYEYAIPKNFFEQINGEDRAQRYDEFHITFIDEMFRFILLGISNNVFMNHAEMHSIKEILTHCRSDRLDQFKKIWQLHEDTIRRYEKIVLSRQALLAQQKSYDTHADEIRTKARDWKKTGTC
jgi:glycosyltransferase involved in cell wall biosynthesis